MTRTLRALLAAIVLAVGLPSSASAAPADCAHPATVAIERFVKFRNRYRETIAVDLYTPADAAGVPLTRRGCRYPVVLESSPYRDWMTPQPAKTGQDEENQRVWWAMRGYVFAFADVPGSGGSDGTWCFWCRREQLSGVDIVNALGSQRWSTGSVAMFGGSYRGINALLVAQHQPKYLKALLVAAVFIDPYTDFFYPGGMPRFEDSTTLMTAFTGLDKWSGRYDPSDPQRSAEIATGHLTGPPGGFMQYQSDHPTRDAWYEERTVHPERITVPTYVLGGWNDLFDRATWSLYDRLAAKTKVLLQGPFTHVPLFVPPGAWPCETQGIDYCGAPFLDRHLKGQRSKAYDALIAKPVRSYLGPAGGYLATTAKPTTAMWTMPLGSRGTKATMRWNPVAGMTSGRWFLRGSVPGAFPPFDSYLGVDGPADQRVEEAAAVSVATQPLDRAVTVIGGGVLSVIAKATAPDADIVVRVVDEYPAGDPAFPGGYGTLVTSGWLRASHRAGHDAKHIAPLRVGKPTPMRAEIWPTGYTFAKGHRIRIDLYPSDTPRFAPHTTQVDLVIDLGSSRVTLPTLRQ